MRNRIAGDSEGPMLLASRHCHAGFWRTLPDLVMDEHKHGIKSEDVDTDQEDHAYDSVRYGSMSRPWMRIIKREEKKTKDWLRFEEKSEESWRTA
jgi:hypothetical protein